MDWGALHRSLEAEYRAGFAQGDLPRRPRCRCARSRAQVNNTCVVARSSMCKRPGACGECICSHAQWLLRAQTAGPAVPPTAPSSARWQEPGACKVPLLCLMCVLGVYPAVVGSHDCAHSSVFQILRDKATNLYTASGVGQQQRIVWSGSTATASGSGLRRSPLWRRSSHQAAAKRCSLYGQHHRVDGRPFWFMLSSVLGSIEVWWCEGLPPPAAAAAAPHRVRGSYALQNTGRTVVATQYFLGRAEFCACQPQGTWNACEAGGQLRGLLCTLLSFRSTVWVMQNGHAAAGLPLDFHVLHRETHVLRLCQVRRKHCSNGAFSPQWSTQFINCHLSTLH